MGFDCCNPWGSTDDNSVSMDDNSVSMDDNSVSTNDNSVSTDDNSGSMDENPVSTDDRRQLCSSLDSFEDTPASNWFERTPPWCAQELSHG